ncbi:Ribosome biogenesis protein BMS1 [Paragonimus heterotremus]|uniref:Ribosome biogenesis protein BMS1 n=1 Tax=Paragonimus heterotremus TaxID=100268 RepID=A0A8J4SQ07_9TREM|nr:Ribosome biogenesis protein BMS1 [Paragonimus heterotremus]
MSEPASTDIDESKKKHRAKQSGPKVKKRVSVTPGSSQHNVKAFAVQHTTKAARLVQRTLDYHTKKHHLPRSQYIVEATPPIVVALVGPPKSGKTTLLRSLVKHFARQSINVIKGPLTIVVGKRLRLTFIECGCDMNSMLDAAKIADVVLMMVNVRCGLEMYHFEFINMVQVHGLPRIIPVLNHLDTYKDSSASRAVRRKIKQRLWVDLNSKIFLLTRFVPKKYPTVDVPVNEHSKPGDYLIGEVRRLARIIVVKIPRATDWRTSHPYLLIDRLEDITDNNTLSKFPGTDRRVSMYGWVRGAPLPPALTSPGIHIAGLGDFTLADCTLQPDPCPLPCHVLQNTSSAAAKPNRHLAERDRKIYAPMSSLGGVLFDRDATYIDLGGSHYLTNHNQRGHSSHQPKAATQAALNEVHTTFDRAGALDEQLDKHHCVRILGDTPYLRTENVEFETAADTKMDCVSNCDAGDSPEHGQEPTEDVQMFSDDLVAGFLIPAGTQPTPKPDEGTKRSVGVKSVHLEVKEILDEIDWKSTNPARINWNRVIYGQDSTQSDVKQTKIPVAGGLLYATSTSHSSSGVVDSSDHDFTLPLHLDSPLAITSVDDWLKPEMSERVANLFTTGQWDPSEDAKTLLQSDLEARNKLALEEANKHAASAADRVQYKPSGHDEKDDMVFESDGFDDDEEMEKDDNSDDDGIDDDDMGAADIFRDSDSRSDSDVHKDASDDAQRDPNSEFEKRLLRPTKRQKLLEKRKRHKELFGKLYEEAAGGPDAAAFYDKLVAAKEAQLAANRAILQSLPEEALEQLEGFPPGTYVRLEFEGIPHQFIDHFNPCQPLVAGGLPSAEESKGFLQVRFRTHRWLKRVLRSNDPITVSIGWRRYQTVGVFSKEEHNLRNRFLKYSLPHEHCLATIYGPLVPAKTGVVFFVNSAWRPQSDTSGLPTFRVAGTGSVTSADQSFQVMKKLKLIGEPYKIFSKTAFIRGMFNSALEVSKMIGARIQTVSNVRGLIKAALTNPSVAQPGDFRATFEAQIGKSDLVFLRSFVAVDLPKYYNPVLNRLCPIEGEEPNVDGGWRLMRTLNELRQATGTKPENRVDSQYKPIHRPVYVPAPLYLPTKLVAALPFAQKPKTSRRAARQMLGGDPVQAALYGDMPPPVKSSADGDHETRHELLARLRQLHADFKQREHAKMIARVTKHKKEVAKQEKRRAANTRDRRKTYFARHGGNGGRRHKTNEQN